jgi:Holliday junction resolvase RusA-like endonuclease
MSELLVATIPGKPRPQGSMQLSRDPRTGKEWAKYGDQTVLHRNLAVAVLRAEWEGDVALDQPVAVRVTFQFARPKSHYGTGRNSGVLKGSAPLWHTSAPDGDKLCRLVGDALVVAGVLADDALIALWRAEKVWGDHSSTKVEVHAL